MRVSISSMTSCLIVGPHSQNANMIAPETQELEDVCFPFGIWPSGRLKFKLFPFWFFCVSCSSPRGRLSNLMKGILHTLGSRPRLYGLVGGFHVFHYVGILLGGCLPALLVSTGNGQKIQPWLFNTIVFT